MTRQEAVSAIYRVINCDIISQEFEDELRATAAAIEYDEFEPMWIPVSERLPTREEYIKNDGRFIVSDGNRVEQGLFDIYADGHNEPYWPYQSCQPVKWMPLPEPWKGE